MALRDRIRRLRQAVDEEAVTLVSDDGEEMRVPEDAALRVLAALWKMDRGEDPEDPLAERLIQEEHRGWREKDPVDDGTLLTLAAQLRESKRRQEAKATDGA